MLCLYQYHCFEWHISILQFILIKYLHFKLWFTLLIQLLLWIHNIYDWKHYVKFFCLYGNNSLECYMLILQFIIIRSIITVNIFTFQVISFIVSPIQLKIVGSSEVRTFFLTEYNFLTIWLIPYFIFTYLHN